MTLVDLDLINPYFRSSEYGELLKSHGVDLIAPLYANTTLDLPTLSPRIASVFDSAEGVVLFDVGGDDAGAAALGGFSTKFQNAGYEMLYVVNQYRVLSTKAAEAESLLYEIEATSRLRATGLVNNSHLKGETTAKTILDSDAYAHETAKRLGLPLKFTTAPRDLASQIDLEHLYPIDIYVKSPWE